MDGVIPDVMINSSTQLTADVQFNSFELITWGHVRQKDKISLCKTIAVTENKECKEYTIGYTKYIQLCTIYTYYVLHSCL